MWLSRTKSKLGFQNQNQNQNQNPSSPASKFSHCSSFKDIQTLSEDTTPTPLSPKVPSSIVRRVNAILRAFTRPKDPNPNPNTILPPNLVVLYFTSLRVVRPTFEACRSARAILASLRAPLDERDLSMDRRFAHHLHALFGNPNPTLPRVFIAGRYVGGADELTHLHETGQLRNLLQALPKANHAECDACGAHRFVLCHECSGARKCHTDKGGFRTCTACNENGLIRCPSCCFAPI